MKRVFDLIISLILIVVFSPFIIVTALLIYFKIGQPVLFKQVRPGLNENLFTIYKFRTMTDERDKNGELLSDEKRLLPIGRFIRKTSLDELPQLFNFLKGDMSFVGA
jgi:lipopolysaccharide/colanic/teichoic acid biosynthesis glycosyltransferase